MDMRRKQENEMLLQLFVYSLPALIEDQRWIVKKKELGRNRREKSRIQMYLAKQDYQCKKDFIPNKIISFTL